MIGPLVVHFHMPGARLALNNINRLFYVAPAGHSLQLLRPKAAALLPAFSKEGEAWPGAGDRRGRNPQHADLGDQLRGRRLAR